MKIPVLYTGELGSFLGPRRDGEIVEPSSDEVEQYEMFFFIFWSLKIGENYRADLSTSNQSEGNA